MIDASADIAGLSARLTAQAAQLARSRTILIKRRRDERRWRSAALLWPLFGLE